jgi:hypothetical protein
MRLNLTKCVLFAALVLSPLGCESETTVIPDDDDASTTVIEERETIVQPDSEPDAGVEVNVGGEPGGIEVDVDRDTDTNQP